MSLLQIYMAGKVLMLNNLAGRMNSVPLVDYENTQHGGPEQKHFRTSFGVNLLVCRLFGGAPIR
jgi:hypothetical protein